MILIKNRKRRRNQNKAMLLTDFESELMKLNLENIQDEVLVYYNISERAFHTLKLRAVSYRETGLYEDNAERSKLLGIFGCGSLGIREATILLAPIVNDEGWGEPIMDLRRGLKVKNLINIIKNYKLDANDRINIVGTPVGKWEFSFEYCEDTEALNRANK